MSRRRTMVGGAVIVAWVAGLATLVRREYFRPQLEQLAEAATRVTPGAVYFGVMQGDRQIGFASSTLDTLDQAITLDDYLVADLTTNGKPRRATARTKVTLTRALHMSTFDLSITGDGAPRHATGTVSGDTLLVVATQSGSQKPDTQRVPLAEPVLLPTLVPFAVALGDQPKVGKHLLLPMFDPATRKASDVGVDVRAESSFVVNDSSVYDAVAARWHGVRPDTIHAWQVATPTGGFNGWVDAQGRIMETSQMGLVLVRMPYQVAFDNWRADPNYNAFSDDRTVLETTAIAANKTPSVRVESLTVRLSNARLRGYMLRSVWQHLSNDTVTVVPTPASAMVPRRPLVFPASPATTLASTPATTRYSATPGESEIAALARRIAGSSRDGRIVAERLVQWVHDSIADRATFGDVNEVDVLRTRAGDCNEHTMLFAAMAAAVGLRARVASGLAYVDGKFYYHAWPEVLIGDWVPVDPTFGQFPADAGHVRFMLGFGPRQADLSRLIEKLKIDVLNVGTASRVASTRDGTDADRHRNGRL